MTTSATTQLRSLFAVVVGEPLELAKSQPHQVLLSTGSIALMGSFASSSQIVDPLVGYAIAIGVEWAYLRGLASDSRANTRWGSVLNWSAFGIVVLWGVLWCAQQFGAITESAGGWWLAAAHVVPVAWLSLCAAQCHRAAMAAERTILRRREAAETERQARLQAERDALALEMERKQQELALWQQAEETKARLKMQSADARRSMRRNAHPERANAEPQNCPNCGVFIESRSAWLAARRWQRCAACKPATE